MNLTLEEQELSVLVNGTDRNTAQVFTDDLVWIERLNKLYKPDKVIGRSHFYTIPTNKILRVSNLLRRGRNTQQPLQGEGLDMETGGVSEVPEYQEALQDFAFDSWREDVTFGKSYRD